MLELSFPETTQTPTSIIRKNYTTFSEAVNSFLIGDIPLEIVKRACGSNFLIRLIDQGVDFEEYRELLEKAVQQGRAQQRLAKLQKQNRTGNQLIFKETDMGAGDLSKVRLPQSNAGRPALDPVLMFRVVFLANLTHTSDQDMALAIMTNLLVRCFLKVQPGTRISRQAIWDYRELFLKSNACETIMNLHMVAMRQKGLISADGGLILDGSFVEAPKQHNTREENELIKAGKGATLWEGHRAKKRQKDIDARCTKKNNEEHYGYKLHALIDAVSKAIICVVTTSANVHDSRVIGEVLNDEEDKGRTLYADSAYCGKELEKLTRSYNVEPCFCEKGYVNRPLTEEQKKNNREKSKIRCRVEHVFGHIETVFKGSFVRTTGIARAKALNCLTALGYNLCREGELLCHQQE